MVNVAVHLQLDSVQPRHAFVLLHVVAVHQNEVRLAADGLRQFRPYQHVPQAALEVPSIVVASGVKLTANRRQNRSFQRAAVGDDDGVGLHVQEVPLVILEVLHSLLHRVQCQHAECPFEQVALLQRNAVHLAGVLLEEEGLAVRTGNAVFLLAPFHFCIVSVGKQCCAELLSRSAVACGKTLRRIADIADFVVLHHFRSDGKAQLPCAGFNHLAEALLKAVLWCRAVLAHILKVPQGGHRCILLCEILRFIHVENLAQQAGFLKTFHAGRNHAFNRLLTLAENAVVQAARLRKNNSAHVVHSFFLQ